MGDNNNIVEETRLKLNKIEKYKEEANNCKKTSITMALCTGITAIATICIAKGCLDDVISGKLEVMSALLLTLTPAFATTFGACSLTKAISKRETLLDVIADEEEKSKIK